MPKAAHDAAALRAGETLAQGLRRLAAAARDKADRLTERWHAAMAEGASEVETSMAARSAEVARARAGAFAEAAELVEADSKRRGEQ